MEIGLVALAVVFLFFALFLIWRWSARLGALVIILTAMLFGTSILARGIRALVPAEADVYEIAPPAVMLTTYGLAVVIGCVILLAGRRRVWMPLSLIGFVVTLVIFMFAVWTPNVAMWSGFLVLVGAVLAFAVGTAVGAEAFRRVPFARFLIIAVIVVLVFQLAIALAQLVGVSFPPWFLGTDRSIEDNDGRVSGTIGHPANLSKHTYLFALMTIGFTAASDKVNRRLAWVAITLAVVLTGLTISRANIAAMAILLVGWVLFYPGAAQVRTRVVGAGALAIASAVFAGPVLDRFEDDPTGGLRPRLLAANLEWLSGNVVTGTGPNSYIAVVGTVDKATSQGFPVHNAVLLLVSEVGVIAAGFFLLAFVGMAFYGVRNFRASEKHMYAPRIILLGIIGLIPMVTTGWGLLGEENLVLCMFVFGFLNGGRVLTSSGDAAHSSEVAHVQRPSPSRRGHDSERLA